MTTEGVDYAWTRPSPAALAQAGKRFACRYLCGDPSNTKCLTAAEAQALSSAGIAIVSNWEWTNGDAKKGYTTGRAYATEALKQATACGMPAGRPIYFSVDFAPSSSDWSAISEYFRGIRSVLGLERTGIYGGYDTIAHAAAGKWASWFWQTYAWSNGRWHPSAHIQQYRNGVTLAGADLDLNRAMTADYGQWGAGDVALTSDDLDAIAHKVWDYAWTPDGQAKAWSRLRDLGSDAANIITQMDAVKAAAHDGAASAADALAAAVMAKLPAAAGGLTPADVEQAVRAAFAAAFPPAQG